MKNLFNREFFKAYDFKKRLLYYMIYKDKHAEYGLKWKRLVFERFHWSSVSSQRIHLIIAGSKKLTTLEQIFYIDKFYL